MKPEWIQIGFETVQRNSVPPWFRQVHGKNVLCLDNQPVPTSPQPADAGFSRTMDQTLYVFTADCLPVLLFGETPDDPIAAIHCGWRGALQGIVSETLSAMRYPTKKITAVFGPSIGPCCFEVRADFIECFEKASRPIHGYLQTREGKTYCDLSRLVGETELAEAQLVLKENRCTVCSVPPLPSYRRNGHCEQMIRSWIRKSPSGSF